MGFPETNPQIVSTSICFPVTTGSGVVTTEVIIAKTKKLGTVTEVWAMTDKAAAATANMTIVFYNRGTASGAGTAFAGTAEIATLGGAATAWVASEPRAGTVANNTDIAVDSYITAKATRSAASTATAFDISVGLIFVPGKPAAVGSIGA